MWILLSGCRSQGEGGEGGEGVFSRVHVVVLAGDCFSRDQSTSSSMSVSSPPLSPNMGSHRAKDCLQPGSPTGSARSLHHTPHVSHTPLFMVQMQQGSTRLVPHTTRSQVRTYVRHDSCMCASSIAGAALDLKVPHKPLPHKSLTCAT